MRLLTPLLVFVLLAPVGCKSWFKDGPGKTASRTREKESSGGSDDAWWRKNEPRENREPFGPKGTDSGTDQPASRTQLDSLLAGRVVDEAERPVADAFIQVTLVGEEGKKPIGVNTDRQGLFVIEGLRPGRTYELSARYEEGRRVLGQTVQVRAPNARVFMRVTEAGVSSLTPAAQPNIGETGPFAAPKPKEKSRPETPPSSLPTPDPIGGDPLSPSKSEDYSPSGNVNRGSGNPPPPPARKSNGSAVDPSLVGEANDPKRPMPATIPSPNPTPSRYEAPRPNPPPPRPAPPKPVTSSDSSLGSDSIPPKFDFTLLGLDKDSEWKFSTASGRLVLLDFWSTTCPPCLKALPETNQLASLYAASGLEVVGIACEAPDSFEVQSKNVSTIGQRNRLKYGLYLDGDKNPTQRLFQVKAVPTMVLLDRKGNVLWRGSGASRENFDQLEDAIKRGLKRQ